MLTEFLEHDHSEKLGASIKSPELNAPRTSQIQDMVNLNGECS
jgi:hypothetical protein